MKGLKSILFSGLIILALTSCGGNSDNKGVSTEAVNSASLDISEVVGVGRVETESEITGLAAVSGGIVTAILADEGDTVKKDDPLVKLDDKIETLRVKQLQSRLRSDRLKVENDKNSLEDAEIRLEVKQKQLQSFRILAETGAETRQALDDLEAEVKSLKISAEKIRTDILVSESQAGSTSSDLELAIAELERKTLKAPSDGTVLDFHIKTGASVQALAQYADFAPSGQKIVSTEVDELFAARVKNGQQARIRFIGSDSTIATGKVTRVSPWLKKKSLFAGKSGEQEDRLVREITVTLESGTSLLLNSKVECIISLKN